MVWVFLLLLSCASGVVGFFVGRHEKHAERRRLVNQLHESLDAYRWARSVDAGPRNAALRSLLDAIEAVRGG